MKRLVLLSALMTSLSSWAYQVTGNVQDVTDTKIVVMKGKEKFEIARNATSKVTGDLKKGAKVTVEYTMAAQSIEVKK